MFIAVLVGAIRSRLVKHVNLSLIIFFYSNIMEMIAVSSAHGFGKCKKSEHDVEKKRSSDSYISLYRPNKGGQPVVYYMASIIIFSSHHGRLDERGQFIQ